VDRIWLKHYPPGVPAEIDVNEYASVREVFEESCRKFATRPAFSCMGRTITFADLDALSSTFGAWLQSIGCAKGTRVALMMPNILQYPVCVFGTLRAGCTVVNVNPLYTARELEHQLADSGAEIIVVVENFARTLQEVVAKTKLRQTVVTSIGEMLAVKGRIVDLVLRRVKKAVPRFSLPGAIRFTDAMKQGRKVSLSRVPIGHDDLAFLQYTGGTTGIAKGAMLLHRNLVANVSQVEAWNQPMVDIPPKIERMIIVTALPLYHIFALTACFLFSMRVGGMCILIPNPRDIPGLVKELSRYKVNIFPAVNTLYNALLNNPNFGKIDWSMLKCTIGGGMAVQKPVADAWVKATGRPIIEGYGLSETSPVLTCNRGDISEWTGTIGLPLPSTEISIRDDTGRELPIGEQGEICARGPQVMAGYWKRPDETAKAMTEDGFFRTGDVGMMDEQGRVRIVDRKKDMISVSGFKVFPNEVEEVAMSHGGLLECAVVGVPDKHSGEVGKLYAVRKKPDVTADDLRAFLAARLASYKVPKQIEFRDELPKTNVGKILRRALRDEPSQPAAN